jgi:hypothetical protein|eukprot:COSAG06_NODE_14021_length_1197_cov_1.439891_1_plen_58_part_00
MVWRGRLDRFRLSRVLLVGHSGVGDDVVDQMLCNKLLCTVCDVLVSRDASRIMPSQR